MVGTMTGSVFPKIGKSIKITLCCGSILVLCYITMSNWSEAMLGMASIFSDSPAPSAKPTSSILTTATVHPAAAKVAKPTHGESDIEYVVKVAPAPVEPVTVETKDSPEQEAEAKPESKNPLRKIGSIFHKKKKADN